MGAITTAIIAGAAVAGAGATIVGAQQQSVATRRAENRAKGIAADEKKRQKEIADIQSAKEAEQSQKLLEQQRLRARGKSGRRSLLTGSELGTESTLG
jgi:Flp pilus assembly protein TadB